MKLLPMLTVLFVGLKLTDYIEWSWWWVTSPIWGTIAVALVLWLLAKIAVKFLED